MALFYLETDFGCGIRCYRNLKEAKKGELAINGSAYFRSIRKATDDDIRHVRAMGGYIPADDE